MNKLIKTFILFGLGFMILLITEINTKLLFALTQMGVDKWFDLPLALLKALGFGVATTTVIIKHNRPIVKVFFVLLDMALIFIYYHFEASVWWKYAGYVYPIYVGTIMLAFGFLAHQYIIESNDSIELKSIKIQQEINNLKKSGRGKHWEDDPDRVTKIEELESQLKSLKNEKK